MLGFPVGVSRNRKTPCWLLKGVYVWERVTVCFWMSLLLANSINPRRASLRFQTFKQGTDLEKSPTYGSCKTENIRSVCSSLA